MRWRLLIFLLMVVGCQKQETRPEYPLDKDISSSLAFVGDLKVTLISKVSKNGDVYTYRYLVKCDRTSENEVSRRKGVVLDKCYFNWEVLDRVLGGSMTLLELKHGEHYEVNLRSAEYPTRSSSLVRVFIKEKAPDSGADEFWAKYGVTVFKNGNDIVETWPCTKITAFGPLPPSRTK